MQVEFDNPQTKKMPLNPRHLEWKGSCGCLAPTATRENSDRMGSASSVLRWGVAPGPIEHQKSDLQSRLQAGALPAICQRSPRCSDPYPRRYRPYRPPRPKVAQKHNENSSSLNKDGHTFMTDGMDRYLVIDLLDDRRHDLLPQTLTAARTNWHRDFPYSARIPSVTANIMRPINKRRTNAKSRQTGDQSDNDIPFIYEMRMTPDTASESNLGRKRPAPASRDMTIPKRGRTRPS